MNEIKVKHSNGGRSKKSKDEQKKQQYQRQASDRAGTRIKEAVLANDMKYLWTLTYEHEETRKEVVQYDFRQFMRRLRYAVKEKIPFVAVIEIQEERSEKAGKEILHMHFATDRRINIKKIEKAWQQGYVYVSKHNGEIFKVASYLAKYIKKDIGDSNRLEDENRYIVSRGLKKADRQTVIMSDKELEHLKSKADIFKEFEQGVWLKLTASLKENKKNMYFYKDENEKKYRKLVT